MSGNTTIRGNEQATTTTGAQRTGHLAVVASTDASTATTRARTGGGVAFGAAVETTQSRHQAGVRAIAAQYGSFEEALLPMVLASGVTGDAAVAVADAIMNNPNLRAQAERAFQRARLSAV